MSKTIHTTLSEVPNSATNVKEDGTWYRAYCKDNSGKIHLFERGHSGVSKEVNQSIEECINKYTLLDLQVLSLQESDIDERKYGI